MTGGMPWWMSISWKQKMGGNRGSRDSGFMHFGLGSGPHLFLYWNRREREKMKMDLKGGGEVCLNTICVEMGCIWGVVFVNKAIIIKLHWFLMMGLVDYVNTEYHQPYDTFNELLLWQFCQITGSLGCKLYAIDGKSNCTNSLKYHFLLFVCETSATHTVHSISTSDWGTSGVKWLSFSQSVISFPQV